MSDKDAYGNALDYELDPVTVEGLRRHAEWNSAAKDYELKHGRPMPEDMLELPATLLLDWIRRLTDEEKFLIIMDLLTLGDALGQAVSQMRSSIIGKELWPE